MQVTAQQASEVQPGQTLPTLALSNGTDAAPPLAGMSAQAAAVAQAQSTLSGGGPPQSLSLGGPSDMQMCQELGLLPTSPLSTGGANGNGHSGAAALAAAAALPPILQAQPAVVQPASLLPAQPAQAAQAPMAVAQQVVLGGQQQAVNGTLVTGTAVVNMQHTTIPTSQVGISFMQQAGLSASNLPSPVEQQQVLSCLSSCSVSSGRAARHAALGHYCCVFAISPQRRPFSPPSSWRLASMFLFVTRQSFMQFVSKMHYSLCRYSLQCCSTVANKPV